RKRSGSGRRGHFAVDSETAREEADRGRRCVPSVDRRPDHKNSAVAGYSGDTTDRRQVPRRHENSKHASKEVEELNEAQPDRGWRLKHQKSPDTDAPCVLRRLLNGRKSRRVSMNVEYTGRQVEVTPVTRKQVESGLQKLTKILGDNFDTHVILSVEKRRHIAEITVTVRNHPPIVGLAEHVEMSVAVGDALDRVERQAVKYNTRWKSKKRQARKRQEQTAPKEFP